MQRYEIRTNSNIFYNKLNNIYNEINRKSHIKNNKDKSLPTIINNKSSN